MRSFHCNTSAPFSDLSKKRKEVTDAEESRLKKLDPSSIMPLTSDAIVSTSSVSVIEHVVFDSSALSYVDLRGSKELTSFHKDLEKRGITLVLVNCCEPLMKQLERCNFFETFPKYQVYPSIIDAVMTIERSNHSVATNMSVTL